MASFIKDKFMAEIVGKVEKKEIHAKEVHVDCGKLSISVTPNKTRIEIDGKELERVTDYVLRGNCLGVSLARLNVSMVVDPRVK